MSGPMTLFMASSLLLVPPVGAFLITTRDYGKTRARADAYAGHLAESVSEAVEGIQRGNVELAELEVACPAAALTGPIGASGVEIAAKAIAAYQDSLVVYATGLALDAAVEGQVLWWPQTRGPPGPCGVPPPLDLSADADDGVFVFRSSNAGVRVEIGSPFSPPTWHYAHDEVRSFE